MKHFFFGIAETEPLWKKFKKENGTIDLTEYRDFIKMLEAAMEMACTPAGFDVSRETLSDEDMKP